MRDADTRTNPLSMNVVNERLDHLEAHAKALLRSRHDSFRDADDPLSRAWRKAEVIQGQLEVYKAFSDDGSITKLDAFIDALQRSLEKLERSVDRARRSGQRSAARH
jgi:tetrahydromethanopterin S-methyltransferase subunit B